MSDFAPQRDRAAVTRRRLLGATSAGAAFVVSACTGRRPWWGTTTTTGPGGPGTCRLTPEQTVGPYYIANALVREDIREGHPGAELRLACKVVDPACAPIAGASVDIWHCDAAGEYSGFGNSAGQRTFLRGIQMTNGEGVAEFTTIYPGWYVGRAVHIHVRVHVSGRIIHTGQIYFDEATSDRVFASAPYNRRTGNRVRNNQDGIYLNGGASTLVTPTGTDTGHRGEVQLAVQ